MTKQNQSSPVEKNGLSVRQWSVLLITFLLGIVAVFAVDKFFLSGHASAGTVHAASTPR